MNENKKLLNLTTYLVLFRIRAGGFTDISKVYSYSPKARAKQKKALDFLIENELLAVRSEFLDKILKIIL